MIKLVWGFLFMCLCVHAYAGMIGGSRTSYAGGDTGRARANVVYTTPVMVAVPKENVQTITTEEIGSQPEIPYEPVKENEPAAEPAPDLTAEIAMAAEYIARLQDEIKQIDSEIARCKKAKTNWTIGTVVGGVGVVDTATGAIVQAVQINKEKKNGATESSDSQQDATNDTKESK